MEKLFMYLTENYEVFGLTLAGSITLYFIFKDLYNKTKQNKEDLEKFKEEQSKKCEDHIKDGKDNFKSVESKIDKAIDAFNLGFTTLNGRIETLTTHIIDFFKENKK